MSRGILSHPGPLRAKRAIEFIRILRHERAGSGRRLRRYRIRTEGGRRDVVEGSMGILGDEADSTRMINGPRGERCILNGQRIAVAVGDFDMDSSTAGLFDHKVVPISVIEA